MQKAFYYRTERQYGYRAPTGNRDSDVCVSKDLFSGKWPDRVSFMRNNEIRVSIGHDEFGNTCKGFFYVFEFQNDKAKAQILKTADGPLHYSKSPPKVMYGVTSRIDNSVPPPVTPDPGTGGQADAGGAAALTRVERN